MTMTIAQTRFVRAHTTTILDQIDASAAIDKQELGDIIARKLLDRFTPAEVEKIGERIAYQGHMGGRS